MSNIYSTLDFDTKQMIQRLEHEGWKFEDDYWEDHHKGDPYCDVKFKSPEMREYVSLSEDEWKKITEKFLRELAAYKLAVQWVDALFYSKSHFQIPIAEQLMKHFIKQKSGFASGTGPWDNKMDFTVKVSPTLEKTNKPKKVKVTIEIL